MCCKKPGFNRTFLVLKLSEMARVRREIGCFNRTFLVLKRLEAIEREIRSGSFNRTFLVLKQTQLQQVFGELSVLIAPFWY